MNTSTSDHTANCIEVEYHQRIYFVPMSDELRRGVESKEIILLTSLIPNRRLRALLLRDKIEEEIFKTTQTMNTIPQIITYNPKTDGITDIRDGVREMKKLLAEAEKDCYAYKPKPVKKEEKKSRTR